MFKPTLEIDVCSSQVGAKQTLKSHSCEFEPHDKDDEQCLTCKNGK